MKRELVSSNTFKTEDKKPLSFEVYKTDYGTGFIVRGDRILFKDKTSITITKKDLKRIKKAVREFIKKETLYTYINWKYFLGDKIHLEFSDCLD